MLSVLWIFYLNLVTCVDVGFLTRRQTPSKYNSPENYIKIYTESQPYETRRTGRYVYPKSSIQTSYNQKRPYYDSKSAVSQTTSRKKYFSDFDDPVEFTSDPVANYNYDALQSDYGDFVNYDNNYNDNNYENNNYDNNNYVTKFHDYLEDVKNNKNSTPNIYINHSNIFRRPNFNAKNSSQLNQNSALGLDQNFLTTLSSISKHKKYNLTDEENVNTKVHKLLTKYLAKLHRRKKQQNLNEGNNEFLDVNSVDNIETSEETILPHDEHTYDSLAEDFFDTNITKGKVIDPSQFILLKNQSDFFKKKFLSLFTIVKFQNTACQSSNTMDYYEGVCYHSTECTLLNGTAMGNCADGYGVCCVFIGSCGGTSNQNCTYFQSPNYPNYYPSNGTIIPPAPPVAGGSVIDPRLRLQLLKMLARQESTANSLFCSFQISKISADVRKFRIEFVDLELTGPINGTCVTERFVVTGQNINDIVPAICGYNTGQHIDVDVTDVAGPIQIAIIATAVQRKKFRIRVCQITDCTSPQNCLQYYRGITGSIQSFNYDQASSLSRSVPGYFNNLNYAICIRKERNYCSITYTVVNNGTTYPFQIRNVDELGQTTVPPGQAGAEIFSCPTDYILINDIRLCGERFNDGEQVPDFTMNAPVTDTSGGPFIVPVRTDATVTGRGFKLFYRQNRCPNA